jgi:uncharacterized protein
MIKRILALLEVTALTVTLMVLAHWLPALVTKNYGKILGNATIGVLWIVPALLLIILTGKKWSEYGLDFTHNWLGAIHFGFWALVVKMAFEGPGFMLCNKFGTPGAFILILLAMLSIWLLLWLFRKDPAKPRIDWKIAIMISLLVLPGTIAVITGKSVGKILLWQIFFLVVVGFGEEFLNRGYIQSRLNEAWGRPWRIWGTQFGPGLLMASLLFGVPHIYQIGADRINILMGVGACLGGLFFGLIREKTGSITAGVIAHGVANAAGQIYMYL